MEIHPAHGPIKSIRDFLLHLSMIVLGILIALGIEQLREHSHARHLVREARKNFRAEVDIEKQDVTRYLGRIAEARKGIATVLAGDDPPAHDKELANIYYWQYLVTGGWDTAVATQALSYMDYSEVQRYTRLYTAQKIFNNFEEKIQGLALQVKSYEGHKLTAEERRSRDQDLTVLLGYLDGIDTIGRSLLMTFDEVEESSD